MKLNDTQQILGALCTGILSEIARLGYRKIIKQSMNYALLKDALTQNARLMIIFMYMIGTVKGQTISTKLACNLINLSI